MDTKWAIALGAAVCVAALAALRGGGNPEPSASAPPSSSPAVSPPMGAMDPTALPPNHPPIDPHGNLEPNGGQDPHANLPPGASAPGAGAQGDALKWQAPARWAVAQNPSTMRLATYKIPAKTKGVDDAELSVTRAGGSTDANITRWIGQFEPTDRSNAERATREVAGLKVTTVLVKGTFLGGGMMGAPSEPKPKWAMLAAIVETGDTPHFFKMTGPEDTVTAARIEFDTMIAGIKK